MQQPPGYPPPAATKSNKLLIIVAIVGVGLLALVAVIGVLAALGISGMRKYVSASKEAEGRSSLGAIARGAAVAAESDPAGSLPPSAAAVPSSLAQVSGRKYMSAPSDWTTPGWKEIGFEMSSPQYFEYSWERSTATQGVAIAKADLDGDGAVDVTFELAVTCSGTPLACIPATSIVERR